MKDPNAHFNYTDPIITIIHPSSRVSRLKCFEGFNVSLQIRVYCVQTAFAQKAQQNGSMLLEIIVQFSRTSLNQLT